MFYYTGFNPFNPPRPGAPGKPPGGEKKKDEKKPPAPKKEDRMCLFVAPGGRQVTSLLPPSLDQATRAASTLFEIPLSSFSVRLSVSTKDAPAWFARFSVTGDGGDHFFIGDDPSYQFYVAGRPMITFQVWVFDKTKDGDPKGFPLELIVESKDGKGMRLAAAIEAMDQDLKRDAPFGAYIGTLSVQPNLISFKGKAGDAAKPPLAPPTPTPSPSSLSYLRPRISLRFPARTSLEVSITFTSSYLKPSGSFPPAGEYAYDGKKRIRWVLTMMVENKIEDLLTGMKSTEVTWEAQVFGGKGNGKTFQPGFSTVSPSDSFCLPIGTFVPNLDKVLRSLGLALESRTAFFGTWMSAFAKHKHIAYKIVPAQELAASADLQIVPNPDVLIRILVLFKGISDGGVKDYAKAGIVQAEHVDWGSDSIVRSTRAPNTSAIEYGALEC